MSVSSIGPGGSGSGGIGSGGVSVSAANASALAAGASRSHCRVLSLTAIDISLPFVRRFETGCMSMAASAHSLGDLRDIRPSIDGAQAERAGPRAIVVVGRAALAIVGR